jgi:hypothetical protein
VGSSDDNAHVTPEINKFMINCHAVSFSFDDEFFRARNSCRNFFLRKEPKLPEITQFFYEFKKHIKE